MKVRARFPDGMAVVVHDIRAHTTFDELITAISKASGRDDLHGAGISRANGPGQSEKIRVGTHGSCKPYPQDGDTLRVEPVSKSPSNRGASSSSARGRGRRRGLGRGSSHSARDGIASLAGLRSKRKASAQPRPVDYDDPRDTTWAPDLADEEEPVARKRPRRPSRGPGMVLGDGSGPSRPGPSLRKKKGSTKGKGNKELFPDALLPQNITANLGAELAAAAMGSSRKGLAQMRNVMQNALQEREKETAGGRRLNAAMAKSYEMLVDHDEDEHNPTKFSVRFKARGERSYEEDEDLPLLPEEVLRVVIANVVRAAKENPEDEENMSAREKIRAREMSIHSPRVFWNLVRLYGGDVDEGLKKLCPDEDWSWLNSRRRRQSEKAKRNRAMNMD